MSKNDTLYTIIMRPSYRLYVSCPSVRLSVRLSRTGSWLENEKRRKIKIGINVAQGTNK